jgi:hypothetical protein
MTIMMQRYEQTRRVQRVKITNRRGRRIEEGQESKVYRVRIGYYPSGSKYEYLVWSKELGKCVWVREDDVLVLAVSLAPIHTF